MRLPHLKRVLLVTSLGFSFGVLIHIWIHEVNDYYYMNFGESRGLTVYDLYRVIYKDGLEFDSLRDI